MAAKKTTAPVAAPHGICHANECELPRLSAGNLLCKAHSDAYRAGTFRLSATGMRKLEALVAAGLPVAYGARSAKVTPAKPAAKPARKASTPPTPAKVARPRVAKAAPVTPTVVKS
jgi:hypothetical protein